MGCGRPTRCLQQLHRAPTPLCILGRGAASLEHRHHRQRPVPTSSSEPGAEGRAVGSSLSPPRPSSCFPPRSPQQREAPSALPAFDGSRGPANSLTLETRCLQAPLPRRPGRAAAAAPARPDRLSSGARPWRTQREGSRGGTAAGSGSGNLGLPGRPERRGARRKRAHPARSRTHFLPSGRGR